MAKQDELTPEQSEAMEIERQEAILKAQEGKEKAEADQAIKDERAHAIRCGMALKRIKGNPDFQFLFTDMFLVDGKEILWQNIRHLTEAQMMGRGSDKNQTVIDVLHSKVKSRLDLESFINTIESDEEAVHEAEQAEKAQAIEDARVKQEEERQAQYDKRGE